MAMVHESAAVGNELDSLSGLFRLLSDRTRLHILTLLARGERNVSSLCEELQLPQPTVSHHLGLLRLQNLIDNRRSGKQVFYAINGRIKLAADKSFEICGDGYSVKIGQA